MRRWSRPFAAALLASLMAWLLAACAHAPSTLVDTPILRLAPAALDTPLALQQQLTVSVGGRTERVELALEADAEAVNLALLDMGQVLARLVWDGTVLQQQRLPGWPEAASGERVLSDLQLVYWPLPAIAAALPEGWRVSERAGERLLSKGMQPVIRVRHPEAQRVELEHLGAGYRIDIQSRSLGTTP